MDYSTLKSDVAAYLHRTDLTTPIVSFIEKARQRLGRDLRAAENEVTTTIATFTNGVGTLPDDYREMRDVRDSNGHPLYPATPTELNLSGTSYNYAYAVSGYSLLVPGGADITIRYWQVPSQLVNNSDTNDVLDTWPNLWLYAAVMEGAVYCHDAELAMNMKALYADELADANRAARDARVGASPSILAAQVFQSGGPAL